MVYDEEGQSATLIVLGLIVSGGLSILLYYNKHTINVIRASFMFKMHVALYKNTRKEIPPKNLPHMASIEHYFDGCIRILGMNPGWMTLQGSNTYIVGTGKSRILIDSGEGKREYSTLLKKVMKENNIIEITDVVYTHEHLDHVGGFFELRKEFSGIKFWINMSNISRNCLVFLKYAKILGVQGIENNQVFKVKGATIRSIHTPGHTPSSTCFFWEERKILFSGDCILGHGTTTIFDLHDYMNSLRRIEKLRVNQVLPGHGKEINDVKRRIQELILHRQNREDQILEILSSSSNHESLTTKAIMKLTYPDIPTRTEKYAEQNVEQHLKKLERDKIVHRIETSILPCLYSRGCWKYAKK